MQTVAGFVDVLAMLGMFIAAFMLWVAWELITGSKALGLMLAVATFVVTWLVAGYIGADSALQFFLVEALVTVVVLRVAKGGKANDAS